MPMTVVDANHVHVKVQGACEADATVASLKLNSALDRWEMTLDVPSMTCPFPFETVGDERWTATLTFEPTSISLFASPASAPLPTTEYMSGFHGTVIRTDPGKSATCEYSYFGPT